MGAQLTLSHTQRFYQLFRRGHVLLTFAPASASGQDRSYDWANKQSIALSVAEIGDVLAFDRLPTAEKTEVKFFHDPNMKTELQGKVRKELIIKKIPAGKGYYFTISVFDAAANAKSPVKVTVAVSDGEWAVVTTLLQAHLPTLTATSYGAEPQFYTQPPTRQAGDNNNAGRAGASSAAPTPDPAE